MLPIAEVPMIERVLTHLAAHGVTHAVLSLGYRPAPFIELFPNDRFGDMALQYAVEPEPLDTAGAIGFAAREAGINETFLAINGDNLTDLDVTALVVFHRDKGAEGTIHLKRVEDPAAFGLVSTDADGRVEAFVEKGPRNDGVEPTINGGTYILEPSVLDRIPAGRRVSIEREVFPVLADQGRLYARVSDEYWTDTGTPALYLQAQLDFLDGLRSPPPAPGAQLRAGAVWVLGEPVIDGLVAGPALVGTAAYIHADARVEHSIVGAGARVAAGAIVRDSVLLPGASVHAGAVVEGSIVGENAVVGKGARVTGLCVIGGDVELDAGVCIDAERVPAPA
jgi:NDP-sugar pyrophosphorylase family protein